MTGINYEALQTSINALNTAVSALQVDSGALRILIEDVKKQTDHHDLILVRGYEDHLPLAEIVRNLTKTVSDYIAQKDKEEQKKRDEEQKKREDWNKLKWIIIGPVVPAMFIFLWQAFIFFFKFYPLVEKLSK